MNSLIHRSLAPTRGSQFRLRKLVADGGIAIGVGVFFAILAPFGTAALGWPYIFLYWVGLISFGYASSYGVRLVIDRWRGVWPAWLWVAVLALGIAMPTAGMVIGTGALFNLYYFTASPALIFLYVLVISLGVSTVAVLADYAAKRTEASASIRSGPPSFLRRLPARLAGGDIFAINAEDHYLRVRTSRGDDLVLMRFSDALRELEGFDGLRLHRSWWVARGGVQKILREEGRITILLRDGSSVPVSRANYSKLRSAKWM